MINCLITGIVVIFIVLGAADYLMGNRLGLGGEFERGMMTAGKLLLCMSGMLVLAQLLTPATSPLMRAAGIDPFALAGMFFANDSGGAALAEALADNPAMGRFHGLISGAMLGSTVMFVIPLSVAATTAEQRGPVVYGLACGIVTTPLGCIIGGIAAGFPWGDV